jgi:O-antigen ligase
MSSIFNKLQVKTLLSRDYFSFLFASLTLLILPIHVHFLPPLMILWCLARIIEYYSENKYNKNSNNAYSLLFFLFILYYLWQAAGLIYTSDVKLGMLNIFSRLSLILFPIVLIYPGKTIKIKTKILLRIFVLGTSLFMLFCFSYALYRSVGLKNGIYSFNPHPFENSWLNYFYSSLLTIDHHPSYIAMYVMLSAFICFESWFDNTLQTNARKMWLFLGFLLVICQYFLSSLTGILICLFLIPLYFINKFKNLGKFKLILLIIIVILIALVPLILKNQRVDYLYGNVFQRQEGYVRKNDPRLKIWESALKISKKNLFIGVGIGDVRAVLTTEYQRIGEEQMVNEKYNAHNQFIEVLLENGIIGLTIFLSIFGTMIYIAFADKNLLYGLFIIMMLIFFMFESVLYRLAGVSFFPLFSFLLLYNTDTKMNTIKN